MRKRLSFIARILTVALSLFSTAYARDVSMVTVDWQPYYGPNLLDDGMVSDIVREAFKRGGHNANIEYIPWTRAMKTVEEGEHDIVMGAYYNEDRAKIYHISNPFYRVFVGLIARRDTGIKKYRRLEDLKAYRIGVSRGWANSEAFDAADFLNKDVAKNPTINIQKILRNRIDMMVAAFGIFRYELNQVNGDIDQFTFLEPPLAENALYLLGSKKIPDGAQLITDFNRGLREIQDDGMYDKILKKHGF